MRRRPQRLSDISNATGPAPPPLEPERLGIVDSCRRLGGSPVPPSDEPAPDPHLHSHVLVANLAPGPDSRWSALDGRGLYLGFATARDLYETQLRGELTGRLGVSWRELQGAWADLAGIDPNLSRAFSRRSIQIEAALEQSGRSGRRARQIASVKTRPERISLPPTRNSSPAGSVPASRRRVPRRR